MNIQSILNDVPDYNYFLTVEEMDQSSRALAAEFPGTVEIFEAGKSRQGHPVLCLKIGNGPLNALVFGCPHPNEPIGAMMLEYFSRRLAIDTKLREELGFTWYIVKCSDPDGTKLNEGWFRGPFTPFNYSRNFFRPASHQQVEWTFPITYKRLNFQSPIPETKALMNIIDSARPDLIYSLHNAGFGGAYWYISDPAPELYDQFRSFAALNNVPLSLGEPEMPYAEKLAEAVYRMPNSRDTYDYYEKFTDDDPATLITAGTSSIDYAKSQKPGTFGIVCEVPYFYDPRIENTSPSDMVRKDAILKSCDVSEKVYGFADEKMALIKGYLSQGNPFRVTLENFLSNGPKGLKAKRRWAETSPECQEKATVAEKFDNLQVSRFYNMLILGLLLRAAEYELKNLEGQAVSSQAYPLLERVREEALQELHAWNAELEKDLNYSVIPIKNLVGVQLGSALAAALYVKTSRTGGR